MWGPVCHESGRHGRGIRFFLTKVADATTYRATDAPGLYILAIARTLTILIRRINRWQRRKRPRRRRDSSRSIPGFLLSRPGDLVKIRPAFDKASEIHIHGSYACDMTIFICYFLERPAGIDINTFIFGVTDFPIMGRHLFPTLKARHAHPACTQAH